VRPHSTFVAERCQRSRPHSRPGPVGRVACVEAEATFREQLSQNARAKEDLIRRAPIDVVAAAEFRAGEQRWMHIAGVDQSLYKGQSTFTVSESREQVWRAKMQAYFAGNLNKRDMQTRAVTGQTDAPMGPTEGVRGLTSHTKASSEGGTAVEGSGGSEDAFNAGWQ
jgi:hypothetical protein